MRKHISLLLIAFLLIRLFCLTVAADSPYDVDGWSPSVGDTTHSSGQPIWVTQVDQAHRYAVDVEYQSMTIQVASAIWDVNNYFYHVEMGHIPQDYTGDQDKRNQEPFKFNVSVISYSDLAIDVSVSTAIDNTFSGLLNVSQANPVYTLDKVDITPEPENRVAQRKTTQVSITPAQGWETLINSVIASGVPDDYVAPVGAVTLTISQSKSN